MREPVLLLGGGHDGEVVEVGPDQPIILFPVMDFTPRASYARTPAQYEFGREAYYEQKWALGRGSIRRVFVSEDLKDYEASTLMGVLLGKLLDKHLAEHKGRRL